LWPFSGAGPQRGYQHSPARLRTSRDTAVRHNVGASQAMRVSEASAFRRGECHECA
jgi:hypothetical protein